MADVITSAGKLAVIEKIGGLNTVADFEYIALGADGTAATDGDTQLGGEFTDSGLARMAATVTTDTGNVLQLVGIWTASASKTIEECGIFNDATTGTLLSRSNFNTISVDSDDSVQITYKVTLT